MAVAYRGTSSSTNVSSGNPPATITGQQNGDIIYGFCSCSVAITAATGWTTLRNTQNGDTGVYDYFAYKVVNGTNDAFSPTYTGTIVGMYVVGFSGPDGTTPHEQYGVTQWSGTSATVSPPASTPTNNGAFHLVVYDESSGPLTITTAPPGYTVVVDNSAGNARAVMAYKDLGGSSSGVSTGTVNLVWSGSAYGPAFTSIINAGGGGGGTTILMGQACL
jgi:hypothetical protein